MTICCITNHQLHDHILILSIHCHIHAIDKPSHYDIISHRGCIDHIQNTFVCTMNGFDPMNALHIILYHLDKLHALVTNNLTAQTHSYMMDTLCALTIVFPSLICVCSFCMYTTPATP